MSTILENWNFYVFSFGNWANETTHVPFPGENSSSSLCHPQSILCPAPTPCSLYGRLYVLMPCGQSRLSLHPPPPQPPFLNCFISFSEPKTRWQPSHLPGSLHSLSCHVCLVSHFSPFQAYSPSSIFLFFLNVIVKVFQWDDSKYVYINRGNTLGYILLIPVLCGLFISSLSLSFNPLWVQVRVISNLSTGSVCY